MRNKIVLLVVGCIVVLGSSAVPANGVNIIFSDGFNGWRANPDIYSPWVRLPINWDIFWVDSGTAWFDIGYETHPDNPNFVANRDDRKMVLSQNGVTGGTDAWLITTQYYNVTLCTLLNISLTGTVVPVADPCIIGPIIKVKVLYYDNNYNSKGEATAVIVDHNTPKQPYTTAPELPWVWQDFNMTLAVPADATLAKFEVLNDSSDFGHGSFWFDNFVVTDPVCVNKPSMDLNRDCKVDVSDLAIFVSQWLDCGLVSQGSVTGCL
jgi:hypothetical protein